MILVDTSVWIDHLHRSEPALVEFLRRSQVVRHPMVVGELALGTLRDRAIVLTLLDELPAAVTATHDEVMAMVDDEALFGRGLSLVDAHLLASLRLTPGARLWTRDRRLREAADTIGVPALDG